MSVDRYIGEGQDAGMLLSRFLRWLKRATGIGWHSPPLARNDPMRKEALERAVEACRKSALDRQFVDELDQIIHH